jgi:EmrB/QacA subfamily drug resistance transporter
MTIPLRSTAGRGILFATILASGMGLLDGTIANIATARIGAEFHASFASLQWVVTGYLLPLASLILLGGSLADRLGRRKIFLIGVIWFALASLLCAIAPNIDLLIAARALQGIGGALMTPGSLAILTATIAPHDRPAAVGAWSGLAGVASALGPLLGGWLVQDASWRWTFAINLPLAVAVVIVGRRYIPETRSQAPDRHLDLAGTISVAAGLGLLTYGTTLAGSDGWGPVSMSITAAGIVLLVAFVVIESRVSQPLVPLRLFRDRVFAGANLMTFMTYGALGAVLFVLVLHLQVTAGYGPLTAGLATLPVSILLLLLSTPSGALAARIGPVWQMSIGPVLVAAGLLLTLRIDQTHHDYLTDVLPGVLLFGLGMAVLVAPLTSTVMAAAPNDEAGVASGVNNAVARGASLLAVAILPALAGLHGSSYTSASVLVHGYRIVAISSAALMIGAALVVVLTIGRRPR